MNEGNLDDFMREEAIKHKLGATGQFPEGKSTPNDEGELQLGIIPDPSRDMVFINFGKPVCYIGMSAQQAYALATLFTKAADTLLAEKATK